MWRDFSYKWQVRVEKKWECFGFFFEKVYRWLRRKYSRSTIKRKRVFLFVLFSLIRTFVAIFRREKNKTLIINEKHSKTMEINSWYECKVKMDVMKDDGTTKPETFTYLVDALNFTEAESRIIEEVKPYTSGTLDVANIKRVKYGEIFTSDSDVADKWYKVRCLFVTIDEKTQTEKEIANNMLVQAGTFHEAVKAFDNGMKGSLMDYRIATVQETKIMDVFRYVARSKKEEE